MMVISNSIKIGASKYFNYSFVKEVGGYSYLLTTKIYQFNDDEEVVNTYSKDYQGLSLLEVLRNIKTEYKGIKEG